MSLLVKQQMFSFYSRMQRIVQELSEKKYMKSEIGGLKRFLFTVTKFGFVYSSLLMFSLLFCVQSSFSSKQFAYAEGHIFY